LGAIVKVATGGWSGTTLSVVVPLLPAWAASPPYVPVIVSFIGVPVGVNWTGHDAVPTVAVAASVQGSGGKKLPGPLLVTVTIPVGVIGVPVDVSITVAVHVTVPPMLIVLGTHATLVLVVLAVTVTRVLPELPEWVASPP